MIQLVSNTYFNYEWVSVLLKVIPTGVTDLVLPKTLTIFYLHVDILQFLLLIYVHLFLTF